MVQFILTDHGADTKPATTSSEADTIEDMDEQITAHGIHGAKDFSKLLIGASASPSGPSPWIKSIEDELRRKESYNGSINYNYTTLIGHSIFRVPRQLRDVKPLAYEPLVIALGPYRKTRKMQPSVTEAFMIISATNILLALQNLGPNDFNDFVGRVTSLNVSKSNIPDSRTLAEKLAKQYERIPSYHDDELFALLALDASFIACFLVYLSSGRTSKKVNTASTRMTSSSSDSSTVSNNMRSGSGGPAGELMERRVVSDFKIPKRLVGSIVRDLFLLENQIPVSLIKGVYDVVYTSLYSSGRSDRETVEYCSVDEEAEMTLGQNIEVLIRCINPFQSGHVCARPGTSANGINKGDVEAPGAGIRSVMRPHLMHSHLLDCLYTAVTETSNSEEAAAAAKMSSTRPGQQPSVSAELEARMELPTAVESAIHLRRAGISFKPAEEGDDIAHYADSGAVAGSATDKRRKKRRVKLSRGDGGMGCAANTGTVQSVRFDSRSGTLYLPRVKIGPESEAVLRNLAAYETVALQRSEVSSYLALMDDLIDSAEDVEVLRLSGVLVHSLRDDAEVAALWNSLCTNLQVLYESAELTDAYAGVKQHLRRRMRYKRARELYADFSSRYLSAPWLTASVLGATLLLILTIAQTFYSAAIYYKS